MVAEAAGWKPSEDWWCPKCQMPVLGRDVTNDERHDVRHGGCGAFVETEEPMLHYHTSLDAIMPVVRKIGDELWDDYIDHLEAVRGTDGWPIMGLNERWGIVTSEAIHHCIALLLTIQPTTP